MTYFRLGMGNTAMSPLASGCCSGCGETHVTSVSEPWRRPQMGSVTTPPHCNAPKVWRTWVSSPRLCPAPPPGPLTSVVIRDTRQKMHPHQEGGPLHGTLNSPQPRKVPHVDHCMKGLILHSWLPSPPVRFITGFPQTISPDLQQ